MQLGNICGMEHLDKLEAELIEAAAHWCQMDGATQEKLHFSHELQADDELVKTSWLREDERHPGC